MEGVEARGSKRWDKVEDGLFVSLVGRERMEEGGRKRPWGGGEAQQRLRADLRAWRTLLIQVVLFFFFFLGPLPQHMEVPKVGVQSEL